MKALGQETLRDYEKQMNQYTPLHRSYCKIIITVNNSARVRFKVQQFIGVKYILIGTLVCGAAFDDCGEFETKTYLPNSCSGGQEYWVIQIHCNIIQQGADLLTN